MSAIHRITPDCPPVFPCWVWDSAWKRWNRYKNAEDFDIMGDPPFTDTHWHPDQPSAPTITPTPQEWDECGPVRNPVQTIAAQAAIEACADEIDATVRRFTGHTGALPELVPIIRRHLNVESAPATSGVTPAVSTSPTTDAWLKSIRAAPAQGETPRTDAEALWPASNDDSDRPDPKGAYVMASFARQLERELNEAKAAAARHLNGGAEWCRIADRALEDNATLRQSVAQITEDLQNALIDRATLQIDKNKMEKVVARLTQERDQSRQDLEERCAESDRERAAHLQAYQAAIKERDAARADRDRIEWMSKQTRIDYCVSCWKPTDGRTLRQAIDKAMKDHAARNQQEKAQ